MTTQYESTYVEREFWVSWPFEQSPILRNHLATFCIFFGLTSLNDIFQLLLPERLEGPASVFDQWIQPI